MKKMLMVATVPSMIGQFNMNNIQLLQEMGYEVHVACDFQDRSVWTDERVERFKLELTEKKVVFFQVDFSRNAFKVSGHIHSYKQLLKLVTEQKYDFIHCHTPIAGAITRLVCNKKSVKCIYTAHGFHFYKGSSKLSWLVYYPIEKWCARYTDVLITINKEDYELALKKMKAKKIEYVPGVGVDVDRLNTDEVDAKKKREELGISESSIILLSVGELNENKNHSTVIKAIKMLNNPNIRYIIVGKGKLKTKLIDLVQECGLEDNVHFLGYRNDVAEIYRVADAFVFPSYREGLSVALMEAMASKLPIVCSKIRGNVDLIDGYGGELFNPVNISECKTALEKLLMRNKEVLGKYNINKIKEFDINKVNLMMKNIYNNIN